MTVKKEDIVKEKGIKMILSALLSLEASNLTKLERNILTGILIENKSGKEIQEATQLTKMRVTAIVEKGISRLIGNITAIDTKLQNFDKLAGELYQAQGLLKKLDSQVKKRNSLSEEQLKVLDLPLSESGLSARVVNACDYGNLRKVSHLVKITKTDYLKLRNAGKKGTDEIDAFFAKNELSWGMEI